MLLPKNKTKTCQALKEETCTSKLKLNNLPNITIPGSGWWKNCWDCWIGQDTTKEGRSPLVQLIYSKKNLTLRKNKLFRASEIQDKIERKKSIQVGSTDARTIQMMRVHNIWYALLKIIRCSSFGKVSQ